MRKAWIAVLVVSVALVGCGNGDDEAADDTPAPGPRTTVASSSQTTAASGSQGGHEHGSSECSGPATASLKIVASSTRFDTDCLVGAANQPLNLSYENKDSGNHGLVFLESHNAAEPFFRVDVFSGPKTETLSVPPQKPGTYAFHCQVHPTAMSGTFVVK